MKRIIVIVLALLTAACAPQQSSSAVSSDETVSSLPVSETVDSAAEPTDAPQQPEVSIQIEKISQTAETFAGKILKQNAQIWSVESDGGVQNLINATFITDEGTKLLLLTEEQFAEMPEDELVGINCFRAEFNTPDKPAEAFILDSITEAPSYYQEQYALSALIPDDFEVLSVHAVLYSEGSIEEYDLTENVDEYLSGFKDVAVYADGTNIDRSWTRQSALFSLRGQDMQILIEEKDDGTIKVYEAQPLSSEPLTIIAETSSKTYWYGDDETDNPLYAYTLAWLED
ncbi:MAG: hypothetical protein IKD69_07620 [Solobacterium sp.]|nr:hypothetical protein [Solobacterium sp.]